MSMPNQGARQLFLYDHSRPHWSQGGPLFYDRRMPPPPPGPHGPGAPHPHPIGNHFQNQPFPGQGPGAAPAPQWVRGPMLGGAPPGHGPHPHPGGAPSHQQQLDGFGFNLPWNVANNNHHNHRHNYYSRNLNQRDNHRNHNGRGGGAGGMGGGGGQGGGRNEQGEQRYLCCKCGDYLQNSQESGVHLCDGNAPDNQLQQPTNRDRELTSEEIQSRLGK